MGHAGDEKNRKKREQEKQEDMKKMYKKSFTIKEIHPEPKNRQTK